MSQTSPSASVLAEKPTVLLIVASWAWVLIPFTYGLNQLVVKAVKLFNS